jgi:hypothetical protein
MNMQEDLSELMRARKGGRGKKAPRPPQQFWRTGKQHQGGVVSRDGTQFDLSYRFEDSLGDGDSHKGTVTANVDMEDEEVIFEMEKGPRMRQPPPTPKPKYRSRWMRRQQTTTMGTQTTATNPENLAIKMESLNLEAIVKKRETDLQAEILSGSLRQKRLKKQLQECSRNRHQASATATSVDAEELQLPRSYSFKTLGRTRGRQHGRLAGRAAP